MKDHKKFIFYVSTLISIIACGSDNASTQDIIGSETDAETNNLVLSSNIMVNNGSLPSTYTCDGEGISPNLSWSNPPTDTKSFAVMMHHDVAPGDSHWYWVMYDIPSSTTAINDNETIGQMGSNSVNDLNEYAPPCSQGSGDKLYTFSLYALSDSPDLTNVNNVGRNELLSAISNITLDTVTLSVSYQRNNSTSSTACEKVQLSVSQAGFNDVNVTCDTEFAYITSDTYPSHDLMNGITGTNEQIPVPAVNYSAPIKLSPVIASSKTTIDAALGVAINGVPIYDYSSQGELDIYNYDANSDTVKLGQLDNCGGHAGRGDDYHYHASPDCMLDAMTNKSADAIIGWAYDGYPLYGHTNPDGSQINLGDLDVCNGQNDNDFGYRYHTSEQAPYIFQCLVGEVDTNILPRVSPLSGNNSNVRADLTPPQDGVENLKHVISDSGTRTMTYTYQGQEYYVSYQVSNQTNCYDFEQKTVSHGGIIETGTFCR
ncbi:YHYH protein [Pseudoalteromonas denitrificans]|uniref:Uncharacterized conserved protein, phosphatidylethanolamine-binding protein (PEBP) family n=1 Tax=Pseudoalteromonas denitrificans DSM 6059 TaxID=1123010 RepID=A0A1I1QZA7_9GAMM|nr:YHYH protein [Pseudoalteromonas denitrificans]SFD27307.1 Uncharacterized conserved protein, phosphatidylethanolamine-binding protein (PEBP) family [Pseudoalteromonas denitrificans DSM 6059]